jgi:antitoxin YefM
MKNDTMNAITYTAARTSLTKVMKQVCDDHVPVIITHQNHSPVVMISLEDYQALEETAYLLRNPQNARRLVKSITELERGNGLEKGLLE